MPHRDWRTQPFPDEYFVLEYARDLIPAAEPKLVHGLIPQDMDDKWYVRLRDGNLDLFRSWTGHHIYRLSASVTEDWIHLSRILVNNDTNQWNPSAISDHCRVVESVIDRMLE